MADADMFKIVFRNSVSSSVKGDLLSFSPRQTIPRQSSEEEIFSIACSLPSAKKFFNSELFIRLSSTS